MNRFFRPCSRFRDLADEQDRQQGRQAMIPRRDVREVCLIEEDNQQYWEQQVRHNGGCTISSLSRYIIDNTDTPIDVAWLARGLFIAYATDVYLADLINFVELFIVAINNGDYLVVCARTPALAQHGLENRVFPMLSLQSSRDSIHIWKTRNEDEDMTIIPLPAETLTSLVTSLNSNLPCLHFCEVRFSSVQLRSLAAYQGPLQFEVCSLDEGGRAFFEVLSTSRQGPCSLVVDCHTPYSTESLKSALCSTTSLERLHVEFSSSRDTDVEVNASITHIALGLQHNRGLKLFTLDLSGYGLRGIRPLLNKS